MYAAVKHKSDIVHGPVHLLQEVKAIRAASFSDSEEKVLLDAVKRNAYHAHPHSILVAMLG